MMPPPVAQLDLRTTGAVAGSAKDVAHSLASSKAESVIAINLDKILEGTPSASRAFAELLEKFRVSINALFVTALREKNPSRAREIEKQLAALPDLQVSSNLIQLIIMLKDTGLQANDDRLKALVDAFLPRQAAPATMVRDALMLTAAKDEVLKSGDWLTADVVAKLAGLSESNTSSQPNKWKKKGLIFAFSHNGTDYFPAFALDPNDHYRPYKQLADVLKVFGDKMNGWGLAFWFSSLNSYLDDERPQDLLAKKPDLVVEAAKEEMAGVLHG